MQALLGCLFILVFGVFLFIIGIFRLVSQWIFGGSSRPNAWSSQSASSTSKSGPYQYTQNQSQQTETQSQYSAGNAHHETRQQNAGNGKIFDKNEGEYIDFEEV